MKNNDDLRRLYKRETGEQYGESVNEKERDGFKWFSDDYVEWLEEKVLEQLNKDE